MATAVDTHHPFAAAKAVAGENDKIVVFGSFLTVAEVMEWLNNNKTSIR